MKKAFKISFALASITLLVGCNLEVNPDSKTALMTAINYSKDERIIYSRDDSYTTPAGHTITKGDFKPVWSAIQNELGINLLEHQPAANSGSQKSVDYFRDNWMTKTYADITMGTVYDITNYSVAGNSETILDLKPYLYDENGYARTDEDKDPLPHIAKFLDDNAGVRMSVITAKHSEPEKGAIYYVPYCDGFNDLEKGTIMRGDYVRRLLDDDPDEADKLPQFKFSKNNTILGKAGEAKYSKHFEPYFYEEGEDGVKYAIKYEVSIPEVVKNVPTGKIVDFEKKEGVENIIAQQNKLIDKGEATSYELAKQFRTYINDRYGTPKEAGGAENALFTYYSDLFLNYNACYDIDELVALMRLVKVSSGTLFKDENSHKEIMKEMVTLLPRTCDNMRSADLYRWAGQVFGVRGLESRINSYLYINGIVDGGRYGKHGQIHDARGSKDMLNLLHKMKELYDEGLILQDFDSMTATGSPQGKFADETLYSGGGEHYAGFMLYDYPKDLSDWNVYADSSKSKDKPNEWWTAGLGHDGKGEGYSYDLRMVIGATAKWDIKPYEEREAFRYKYMPFTESWSSVKTSAVCLNAKLVNNPDKLAAAFKLIDYMYRDEGSYLYNFGPYKEGFITEKAGLARIGEEYDDDPDPTKRPVEDVDYIKYQGKRYPCIINTEPRDKDPTDPLNPMYQYKNISGFSRQYLGASLPFGFIKLNAVPYQTMHQNTKHGVDVVNYAINLGTFEHVLIDNKEQIPFYQICPSSFFLTKGQSSAISALLDKNKLGSMFTDSSSSNFNIWDALIMGKETRQGVTLDNYLDTINNKWELPKLETYYQDAYEIMSDPVEPNR